LKKFRRALDITDPDTRWQQARAALQAIRRAFDA
jgi:hypothetical protein